MQKHWVRKPRINGMLTETEYNTRIPNLRKFLPNILYQKNVEKGMPSTSAIRKMKHFCGVIN